MEQGRRVILDDVSDRFSSSRFGLLNSFSFQVGVFAEGVSVKLIGKIPWQIIHVCCEMSCFFVLFF